MKKDFNEFIKRRAGEDSRFDAVNLSKKFIPFYESGERIKIEFSSGIIKSGTIGITTGWKPVFILLLTKRSTGSSWTLSEKDSIMDKHEDQSGHNEPLRCTKRGCHALQGEDGEFCEKHYIKNDTIFGNIYCRRFLRRRRCQRRRKA